MQTQTKITKTPDFSNQNLYNAIDTHKKQWMVTIGDYVLSRGELAAAVVVDAILPVISKLKTKRTDSHDSRASAEFLEAVN
jgi:tRNA G37 N-methylase TrmD